MYVCICNAFTCRDVRKVRDQGVSRSGQVYKKLGCKMQCGKCLETIANVLKEPVETDSLNNNNTENNNFFPVNV
jgi:bacterioferritin-associated ferredoxin